jgi:hypothetical protein
LLPKDQRFTFDTSDVTEAGKLTETLTLLKPGKAILNHGFDLSGSIVMIEEPTRSTVRA